jgi:hypothetical protein
MLSNHSFDGHNNIKEEQKGTKRQGMYMRQGKSPLKRQVVDRILWRNIIVERHQERIRPCAIRIQEEIALGRQRAVLSLPSRFVSFWIRNRRIWNYRAGTAASDEKSLDRAQNIQFRRFFE